MTTSARSPQLSNATVRTACTALVLTLVPLGFAAWFTLDYLDSSADPDPLDGLAIIIALALAVPALLGAAVAGGGVLLRHRAPRTGLGLAVVGLVVAALLAAGLLMAFLG